MAEVGVDGRGGSWQAGGAADEPGDGVPLGGATEASSQGEGAADESGDEVPQDALEVGQRYNIYYKAASRPAPRWRQCRITVIEGDNLTIRSFDNCPC